MRATKLKTLILSVMLACSLVVMVSVPLWAADGPMAAGPSGAEEKGESLTEINKKLTNPVSEIWSITFQQNNYRLVIPGHDDRWSSNLQFQPVLPVALTKDWNLITRPVIPLFVSQPHPIVKAGPPPQVDIQTTTGFGDMVLLEMLSPAPSIAGNWLLGLGPTFIFPTASTDFTGQGKWQVGPAAIVGYLSKKYILGAFVQNWSSFGGDPSRSATNQMNLQPIASYFLPNGWSIGYSGNILANWKADSDNTWTVPIGVGVAKVVKFGRLPVRIAVAGQWMPIHPDNFGQKYNIQVLFAPVIPKLIKGTLFE
jgi:hypothetical protein